MDKRRISEIILEANCSDLKNSAYEAITAKAANKTQTHGIYRRLKTAAVVAAVICLFTAGVSAAVMLSGFETAFGRTVESGSVSII